MLSVESRKDGRQTVQDLIDLLQKLPPDAEISYVDFADDSVISACVNDYGLVEIGPL